MKTYFSMAIVGCLVLIISACSTTTIAYYNTLKLALQDNAVDYTVEQVARSKADLMLVKAGDRDAASLALAYIDEDRYRWVSADKVIFTTHHGIIVETEGLKNDIFFTGNLQHNPLASDDMLAFDWKRKIDISGVGFGLAITSMWKIDGEVSHTYFDRPIPLIKVVETVSFPEYTPFIDVGLSWENTYFLHKSTKKLFASIQKFSPEGDTYEMVYLSRIVREISSNEKGAE